ncbi:MAG TPA: DUF393 domain-containing protein [Thermoplasmata archaeon]|nr:DUF393 domain-containing protein [Thermoplasmata archaeon]
MPSLVLAYDADCGSCTRFKEFVDLLDLRNQIDFVSLIEADDLGLLDRIPIAERHASFHLVVGDDQILSGAAAIPRLLEALPGGAPFSKLVSRIPGGLWMVSYLYASFSRAHDGAACSYHRFVPGSGTARRGQLFVPPRLAAVSLPTYLLAGILGGFVGSLSMGIFVRLPDALCVGLAEAILGANSAPYLLAWTFHVLSGVTIGAGFGYLAGAIHLGNRKPLVRSLFFGTGTGVVVWSVFFVPLMQAFFPWLLTQHGLEASLAAHLALGLVLGVALSLALRWKRGRRTLVEWS